MATTDRDYYELLGVGREANEAEIKRAFRQLARELHPDVSDAPDADERFREVVEAYEVLSNSETRDLYDRYGHAGLRSGGFQSGHVDFGNLADLFSAFFGEDVLFGGRAAERGRDATAAIELSFEEAAFGVEREVTFQTIGECDRCGGDGAEPGTTPERCPTCEGRGRIQRVQQTALGQFVQTLACPECRGRGSIIDTPCTTCHGAGRVAMQRTATVAVPGGIADGQRISLRGQGGAGAPGAPPGDLYVSVGVRRDERFERDGDDVVSVIDLPFTQAALGTQMTVPTLDGEERVDLPAGTQPGDVIVLRGKGVGRLRGRGRGDHRIHVNVLVPRRLTDEQRRQLEAFERDAGPDIYAGDGSLLGRIRAAFR